MMQPQVTSMDDFLDFWAVDGFANGSQTANATVCRSQTSGVTQPLNTTHSGPRI